MKFYGLVRSIGPAPLISMAKPLTEEQVGAEAMALTSEAQQRNAAWMVTVHKHTAHMAEARGNRGRGALPTAGGELRAES